MKIKITYISIGYEYRGYEFLENCRSIVYCNLALSMTVYVQAEKLILTSARSMLSLIT